MTTTSTPYPNESNGLIDPAAYHDTITRQITRTVPWSTPGLRVTRLRLLGERGHPTWDVSYCHGDLHGEPVNVSLPFDTLPRRGTMRAIIDHAKRDGVYAKRLGILDAVSALW